MVRMKTHRSLAVIIFYPYGFLTGSSRAAMIVLRRADDGYFGGLGSDFCDEAGTDGDQSWLQLTGSTVTSTLSFPVLLKDEMRILLVKNFQEFVIQFWKGRVL